MTNEETAILLIGVFLAFAALMFLHAKKWFLFTTIVIIAVAFYLIVMFYDTEKPRELNQSTLEQMREKWKDKIEEPIDGSRD